MATREEYKYTPFAIGNSPATRTALEQKAQADANYTQYVNDGFRESQVAEVAWDKKVNAENAWNTYLNNGFNFSQGDAYKDVMDKILNREKFSYDLNGDALYQQYKDKYIQQGKMAMADTMGQAAAMTGGYGNSYAASVGNQAYQASLQQLNDIVPELYQMAYDRYNQEGQDLYNQYGLLSNERSTEYGMWTDKGNMLNNDRSYHSSEYDNAYNRDYNEWVNKGTMLHNDRTYSATELDNIYDREYAEWATKEGYKYQNVADANAYAQWEAGQKLAEEQLELQKAQVGASKGSNGKYTIAPTAPKLTAADYNEVLLNAGEYAEQGQTALRNYLNGLVARGLSEDEAVAIFEQHFPLEIPESPKKGNTGKGGGGIRNSVYHTLN